jgi:hypothetical protein
MRPFDRFDRLTAGKLRAGNVAACLVLLCSAQSLSTGSGQAQAGTISGTVEGPADIQIQQIVSGTPGEITGYRAMPSTLTYTVLDDSPNPSQDYFQYSFTSAAYSFDTSSSLINGFRSYGFSQPAPEFELGFLISHVYHAYSLTADLGLYGVTNPQISAGFDYAVADDTGTGQEVTVSFVDPPAGVPEPSSLVMAASGALVILAVALVQARRVRPYKPRSALTG